MFHYEKKLQFPVKIATPNPKLAAFIISQYGGPDGELGASMRYLSQRYSMPYAEAKGLLTDIGTEELGHMEMVAQTICLLNGHLAVRFPIYNLRHLTVYIIPQLFGLVGNAPPCPSRLKPFLERLQLPIVPLIDQLHLFFCDLPGEEGVQHIRFLLV